jgi:hypothetical protein
MTIATNERNPLAVMVHAVRRPGVRAVSFASVPLYWELGPAAVRFTRQVVAGMFQAFSPDRFRCATRSPHPDTRRWFKILGFREIGSGLLFEGGQYVQ